MKKHSILLSVSLICCFSLFSSCNQGQKKEKATEKAKKEIYLQLYSVRDDIKADYAGTIAKVAEIGYTGVEAAGYSDGLFYGLTPVEFKNQSRMQAWKFCLHMPGDRWQNQ